MSTHITQSFSQCNSCMPCYVDTVEFVKTLNGEGTILESIINICDWMSHLGYGGNRSSRISKELEKLNDTLAAPGVISSLGNMRDKWRLLNTTDNPNAFTKFIKSIAGVTLDLSKTAKAMNEWGIYTLKEGLFKVKTTFWTSIGCIEGIDLFKKMDTLTRLTKQADVATSPEEKNVCEHKIQLTYLYIIKATVSIAMAMIALTSLLFASLAQGFLFSPVVFLTLTSAYLVLTYVTYFYKKMITQWDEELLIGKKA